MTGRAARLVRGVAGLPACAWAARRDVVLAGVSGVAVFTSFPTWDLFPLAFVALVPLLFVVERSTPRRAFVLALWMGWVTNLGGFYWITNMLRDYGYMPWSVSALLCALLALQQGLSWGAALAGGRWAVTRGVAPWLAYPVALAVAESIMPMIFPWHFGNSQYLNLPFAQAAELGGVVLLSTTLMATNVALYSLVRAGRGEAPRPRWAAVVVAIVVALHAWGAVRIVAVERAASAADSLDVGVVQANIGIYDKHERAMLADQLLLHQRMSAELEQAGADLIVWPETAYGPPAYAFTDDPAGERVVVASRLDRHATRLPPSRAPLVPSSLADDAAGTPEPDRVAPQRGFTTPLLTGTLMWSRRSPERLAESPPRGDRPSPWDVHNSAVLLGEQGHVLGAYDKTMRMIFSEYVPGGRLLWRLTGINLYHVIPAAGDFYGGRPTDGFVLPTEHGDVRIGIMICYEDIMASFGRAIHAGRPQLIVNITNDAWFGDTSEPYLHLALATFRAIEQRTSLVRATNTGVSAVIAPTGRIVAQTPTFEPATLLQPVPILDATATPFVRLGNWTPWLGGAWLAVTILLRRRSARKQASDVA